MNSRLKRFKDEVAKLSEYDQMLGNLPKGYLYCLSCHRSEPYEGVVAFHGWSPRENHGCCLTCGKQYTIYRNGDLASWKKEDPNAIDTILSGRGDPEGLFKHSCVS